MDGIKIGLNRKRPGNYAFFCPSSKLHLTLSNPVAYVDRVTSAILVGLRFGTLVDINGVVNLETGEVSGTVPVKTAENPAEDADTENSTEPAEAAEKPKARRTKSKKEEQPKEEEPKEE